MPYFKITPHPLIIESEDAESAAQKAREAMLHAPTVRYEVVGPDLRPIWVELAAPVPEVASLENFPPDPKPSGGNPGTDEPQGQALTGFIAGLLKIFR
jgi:hypothetical protein